MSLLEFIERYGDRSLDAAAQHRAKLAAAQAAAELIPAGARVGLGTGSTVACLLERLAARAPGSRPGPGVPSSLQTAERARDYGLELVEGEEADLVLTNAVCVDGADRVDRYGCLVKGGGGALLREKLVAYYSQKVIIMVDPTKLVPVFASDFAVPVELVPFGAEQTLRSLGEIAPCDGELSLRRDAQGQLFRTDNGNLIADCPYASIPDPQALELAVLGLPGVVEVGLFVGLLDTLVVGLPDGEVAVWERPA